MKFSSPSRILFNLRYFEDISLHEYKIFSILSKHWFAGADSEFQWLATFFLFQFFIIGDYSIKTENKIELSFPSTFWLHSHRSNQLIRFVLDYFLLNTFAEAKEQLIEFWPFVWPKTKIITKQIISKWRQSWFWSEQWRHYCRNSAIIDGSQIDGWLMRSTTEHVKRGKIGNVKRGSEKWN